MNVYLLACNKNVVYVVCIVQLPVLYAVVVKEGVVVADSIFSFTALCTPLFFVAND